MRRGPIIAIDGGAGSGKSTVGQRLARALDFEYVDTGAMYRAVGLLVARQGDPEAALERAGELVQQARIETSWDREAGFRIELDGEDLSRAVRTPEAALWASRVAALPAVRAALVAKQREKGESGGVVMEGRDIGTVVFPDAEHKFFLVADLEERARRRQRDEGGEQPSVERELGRRDQRDATRSVAPLVPAPDAIEVDTTRLSIDDVVGLLLAQIRGTPDDPPGV